MEYITKFDDIFWMLTVISVIVSFCGLAFYMMAKIDSSEKELNEVLQKLKPYINACWTIIFLLAGVMSIKGVTTFFAVLVVFTIMAKIAYTLWKEATRLYHASRPQIADVK